MDTLLKPRDIYYGEEFGPHLVEKMHRTFKIVRRQIKKDSEQNRHRYNKTTSFDILGVGDMVYVRNTSRNSKLDPRWYPNPYVIVKKTGNHSFVVQNQSTNKTYRLHQRNLRKAQPNDAWLRPVPNTPSDPNNRPHRRTRNAVSSSSSDSHSSSDSDSDHNHGNTPNLPQPQISQRQVPDPVHFPSQSQQSQSLPFPPLFGPSQSQTPTQVSIPTPSQPQVKHPSDPVHWPSQPTPKRNIYDVSSSDDQMQTDSPISDRKKSRLNLLTSLMSSLDSISKNNEIPKDTLNALLLSSINSIDS